MRSWLFLLIIFLCSFQQAPLESLSFPSYNSKAFSLKDLGTKKAIAFVFLMPDCPFCQRYTKTLNQLHKDYSAKGIQLEGVITGDLYTDSEVRDFIKEYKISFPVLHDQNKKLARYFRVDVSPSVAVSDMKGKLLYKGLIDNWPVTPGKTRQFITSNYLKDVFDQVVTDRPVTIKNTEAVGCILE